MDSHTDTQKYKPGVTANGDKLPIRFNTSVDAWAGGARERGDSMLQEADARKLFYKEIQIMVQLDEFIFIYGGIAKTVREKVSKQKLIKYLLGRNPHWNATIFDTIYWDSVGECLDKMPAT